MNGGRTPPCPRCAGERLVRHTVSTGGIAHQCPRCHGTQMALAVLRDRSDERLVPRLWAEANTDPRRGLACPLCQRTSLALVADGVELDLCRPCQSLWFDADELERFPIRSARTRQKTTVDTTRCQPPMKRSEQRSSDDGSVIEDVVDSVLDILSHWD